MEGSEPDAVCLSIVLGQKPVDLPRTCVVDLKFVDFVTAGYFAHVLFLRL